MNFREGWRSFVLHALFFVLVVTGWHELPDGESILPWYVIVASAAVPALLCYKCPVKRKKVSRANDPPF